MLGPSLDPLLCCDRGGDELREEDLLREEEPLRDEERLREDDRDRFGDFERGEAGDLSRLLGTSKWTKIIIVRKKVTQSFIIIDNLP